MSVFPANPRVRNCKSSETLKIEHSLEGLNNNNINYLVRNFEFFQGDLV